MRDMREDTVPRDAAALKFIRQYHHAQGRPPSRREIAASLGVSTTAAQRCVERLVRFGYIETTTGARGIKIVGANTTLKTEDL